MIKIVAITHYLFAAACSRYFIKKDWQSWADKQISKRNEPESWLIDVSLASNIEELSKFLSDLMILEKCNEQETALFSNAVIGYYYLMYLSKKTSLSELLLMSGDEADGGLGATKTCEEFYEIQNQLKVNQALEKDPVFNEMITELYKPFKELAEKQKEILANF